MQQGGLKFVVVNDPDHDFDLMQEVKIDGWTVADVRRVGESGEWFITFFPKEAQKEYWCEIPWKSFLQISQKFADFVKEMESYQVKEPEEM